MSKALVITEKPSVARDIVAALGGFTEQQGGDYWESDDYVVTFAVGHLFELLEPEELDPQYKRWTLDVLPILPERFDLKKKKGQSDRIRTIKKLVELKDVDRLVNACDAGREGELIFREIVDYLGVEKPIQRLWLQSMVPEAIREGFRRLRPGEELEGLAAAAECRALADWLIGMNATRALTKRLKTRKERRAWSAGRVQTPTLALLVERELEILSFVPQPFWRVVATFEHEGETYTGTWFDPQFRAEEGREEQRDDRLFSEERALEVVHAVRGRPGEAEETRKPSRETAPPLFDLTALQREANRRFGWSARRTLGAAQRCYEAHKLLTYPRTDSRCLPTDHRETVQQVLRAFSEAPEGSAAGDYAPAARRLLERGLENTRRTFDDSKVSDHFAIVPTGVLPRGDLSGDDRRLFDLVARRFLGNFHPPAVWERVERVTTVAGERFRTRARTLVEPGWRTVGAPGSQEEAPPLPRLRAGADQASGVEVPTREVESQADETRPPARITEARLLSLMESAGRWIEDEDLAEMLSEKGLGTPATRAEIIENLIAKGYAFRQGKALRPTVKGIRLIDTLKRVHIDRLASAELTGEMESHLAEVEHGDRGRDAFLDEIRDYAREIVERAKNFEYEDVYGDDPPLGPCPACGRPVYESAWYYRCLHPEAGKDREKDCPMRFWKDVHGRYLDRQTVRELIEHGETGVLDGFTARSGRTYRGAIHLDRDAWRLRVRSAGYNEETASETPEYEVNTEPLGECPFSEECQVVETPTHFLCQRKLKEEEARQAGKEIPEPERPKSCGFTLPRTVCKREITRDEAQVYLRSGKTELLTEFTSRFGRPFSATLVLKENGRHGFEFPPRGKGAGKGGAGAEGGAAGAGGAAGGRKAAGRKKTTRKKTTRKKTTRKKTSRKKTASRKKAGAQGSSASSSGKKSSGGARKKAAARSASGRKKTTRRSPASGPEAPGGGPGSEGSPGEGS